MSDVSRMAQAGSFFTDPALKRVRMRLFTVVVVVFTLVCSGSFGMEDVVSGSGPGFTILMIVLLPFFWSVPMAFISSELGSAIPEEGGFGRWCRRGLGEYWGFQTSWWWTLSLYVDSAVYITLALGYIQSKWGLSDNWRWLLGIGLVAFFTFINIRGLDLTGKALIVIQAVVMIPFLALVIWGFAKGSGNPISPMFPPGLGFISASSGGLAIMMWMYSGYESMSTVAAEVEEPQRVIPRAILIAVPIVIATYALTTMAGIRASGVGGWAHMVSDASAGGGAVDFVKAGQLVGGAVLLWAVFASAIASNLGLYTGYLATGSRPSYQLSRDRLYPKFMGRAHKRWGTPWIAILIMGVVDAILVKGSFTTLIVIDVFLLMFSYIPIFIAAIALRIREPNLPRPYRVPIPTWLLAVWVCSPIAIAVYALFTNGSDYLVGGLVGVVSGPIAYLLVKRFYRGTADDALEGSVGGMPAVSSEARRANWGLYRLLATTLAIVAGVIAIALAFYVHSRHPWAVGGNWRIAGVAVSPQRLLAAMGLVMIVGGLLVQRTRVVGGVLVAAAVVFALCLIYTHTWSRTTNVWVWSAPIVLAVLGAVFAGLALKAEIEPIGPPPVAAPVPTEEPREPLVVGAPSV
jgi:amino acid transporter